MKYWLISIMFLLIKSTIKIPDLFFRQIPIFRDFSAFFALIIHRPRTTVPCLIRISLFSGKYNEDFKHIFVMDA